MELNTFFDNFGLLNDAPNSIHKLREMILQLAVQGKLVPQDPEDEPASVLIEKIKAEKGRLVKEKIIRKSRHLAPIKPDEALYELPNGWEWQRLEGVFYPISVGQNKIKNADVESMGKFPVVDQGKQFVSGFYNKEEKVIKIPGPVIIFGDHTRELKLVDFDFVAGADGVKTLRPLIINENYFFIVLKSLTIESRGYGRHYKLLLNNIFPVPPLSEQKRIVAKVDELMALCDELEARKKQASINCIQLNDASIHKLLTAREPKKFSKHCERICNNFNLLYSKPENVAKLRQAILQLAVQGKLVPQDPKDEPASVLLEKIKAEKERLIKKGTIKKLKSLPPIDLNEVPYKLPEGWAWTRLGDALNKLTDGTHHSPPNDSIGGYMYITAKNIKPEGISLEHVTYVSKKKHQEIYTRCDVEFGDILYIKDGATTGIVTINDIKEQFSMLSSVALMKLPKMLYNRFLLYILRSPYYYSLMRGDMSGVAITRVTLTKLNNSLIPLSPVAEQKRIVARVDDLMAFCDELETKLSKSQTDCDRLIEAAVADILAA